MTCRRVNDTWLRCVFFATIILFFLPALVFAQGQTYFRFNEKAEVNSGLVHLPRNQKADIVLTSVPQGLFLEGDNKKNRFVSWQPTDLRCVLRYDTAPGNRDVQNNYPHSFGATGRGSLRVNAGDEALSAGVYYCILVAENDPALTSIEFRIIVQSNASAIPVSPLGTVSLQQGAPLFRWDPVEGVPYYFVLLSEGPVAIERDSAGEIVGLSGLNLIWQVITSETFLRYGEPDPAGNFVNISVPPLLPDIEYNWVVLNSYGPNPNLVSSDVAPIAPSFFEVTRPTLAQKPFPILPAENASLNGIDINFEWTPVTGVSRYRFFLFQRAEFQGNTVQFVVWSQTTGDTKIRLDTRSLLVNSSYGWRVVAENDGRISASDLSKFTYDGTSGWASFTAISSEGLQKRVIIDIRNEVGGSILLPAVTDTFGVLQDLPLIAGNYRYTASKVGFETTSPATFTVRPGQTTFLTFEMKRGASTISGRVVDDDGRGIFNATVEANSGATSHKLNTDENGYFTFSLVPGNWSLRAWKRDFAATDFSPVLLGSGEDIDAGEFKLIAASNSVTGQVLFAEDSRPLQGALIRADNGAIVFEATTGNQGGFRFNLGPGNWTISLDARGYFASPAAFSFELTSNSQVSASFQLFDGALVYGMVSFLDIPMGNVLLKAFAKDTGKLIQSAFTTVQGRYAIGLPAGNYELVVARENFQTARRQLSVLTGETKVEDFVLTESGLVAGKVISLDTGQPAAGATVFAVEDTTLRTLADANGRYVLSLPPDILFQIDASLPGFTSNGPIPVVSTAGQTLGGQDFFLQALSGIIRGRVTDGFAPLSGATVVIQALELAHVTDEEGRFEFEVAPGDYLIEIEMVCHLSGSRFVHLVAGNNFDLEIALVPLRSDITGRVFDGSGAPIAGAEVTATGDTVFSTFSDVSGIYKLCLDRGIFRVAANKAGYFRADTTVVVNEGDLHDGVNFILQESFAVVDGMVQDTSGAPVALVLVQLENETQSIAATSNDDGRYRITGIIPGETRVRAVQNGLYGSRKIVFLGELEQATVDLTLYPSDGRIGGRALDSVDSTGIAAVKISAQFAIEPETSFETETDIQGHYSLDNLPVVPNASYQIFAFKEDYSSPSPAVSIPATAASVNFYLIRKTGLISGRIRDIDTAAPIANARIEASNRSGSRSITFSDSAGAFTLLNLVPSNFYDLSIAIAGYFPVVQANIPAGERSVSLNLLRKYGFVQGKLTDFSSGKPLVEIKVIATPLGLTGRFVETLTNANGNYLLRLAPDFYKIEPSLSHHRNEPAFRQNEVAELDTSYQFDFALEPQTVETIIIQRADRTESPTISNARQHRYIVSALDGQNRPVNIGEPTWSLNVSQRAARIDPSGLLVLDNTYFGDLTIQARDHETGALGKLDVQVFARIDSTSALTLFDDRGLQIEIPRNSVVSRKNLLVSKTTLAPAKKNRARFFTTDFSFTIKPVGLLFEKQAKLILQPPENTTGQKRFAARWNAVTSEWDPQGTTDRGSTLEATIDQTGEYVALAISKQLAIERVTLLPNPFSPYVETNGMPGLNIQFDLSSSAAPNPLLTVKIYNLEGNLVRLLHDQTPVPRGKTSINWDGRADNGALARNGRYLLRVVAEDPTGKKENMKSVVLIK